jgi:hypothetical protein
MRPKPGKLDKKHPHVTREAMEDIRDVSSNHIRYMEPNRDRTLGEADRTGRHYDEIVASDTDIEEGEAPRGNETD